MPAGQVPDWVTVAFVPSTAGAPFTVSFAATLATGVDAAPEVPVPLSATGTIAAATVIVTLLSLQLAGLFVSHSV
jgi:hypothetical protein